MRRLLLLALLTLTVSACSSTRPTPDLKVAAPTVPYVAPSVPDSMLGCAPYPALPAPDASDTEHARFIVELDGAYWDCRGKLDDIKRILHNRDANSRVAKPP